MFVGGNKVIIEEESPNCLHQLSLAMCQDLLCHANSKPFLIDVLEGRWKLALIIE